MRNWLHGQVAHAWLAWAGFRASLEALLVPVYILLPVVAAAAILLGGLALPGPTRRFLDRDPEPWTVTAVVLTLVLAAIAGSFLIVLHVIDLQEGPDAPYLERATRGLGFHRVAEGGEQILGLLADGAPLDGMRILDRFEGTWEGVDALVLRVAYQPSMPVGARQDPTSLPGGWDVDVLCAAVQSPAEFPELRVGRLRWLRHLTGSTGFRDIETESWSFNRRWHISARDRRFANDLIDQRMMSYLLGLHHRFDFKVGGPWLLVLGPPLTFAEEGSWLRILPWLRPERRLNEMLDAVAGFRRHIPRVVLEVVDTSGRTTAHHP